MHGLDALCAMLHVVFWPRQRPARQLVADVQTLSSSLHACASQPSREVRLPRRHQTVPSAMMGYEQDVPLQTSSVHGLPSKHVELFGFASQR
jgi:hypothetical protein